MTERPTNTLPDKQHRSNVAADKHAHAAPSSHEKKEDKIHETKTEVADKKESKKEDKKHVKKEFAESNGRSLSMSLKHGMYISKFIKNMKIDEAMAALERVMKLKRAVPFRGEIPHRKGRMMSGRYPVNASKLFIQALKGLKGNSIANGMDLEKTRIVSSNVSWASRPMRSGGRHMKRVNLFLVAREMKEGEKKNG